VSGLLTAALMYPLVSILSLAMVCGHNQYHALSAKPPCFAEALRRGGSSMAKAGNPPGAKELEARITRILTNRMNPLVEIGAIRVYASAFFVFSGVFVGRQANCSELSTLMSPGSKSG